jgi:hypothetical protein
MRSMTLLTWISAMGFEFQTGPATRIGAVTDEGGWRYSVQALLDGRLFEQFVLDVSVSPNDPRPVDSLTLRPVLNFAGIDAPTIAAAPVRCRPGDFRPQSDRRAHSIAGAAPAMAADLDWLRTRLFDPLEQSRCRLHRAAATLGAAPRTARPASSLGRFDMDLEVDRPSSGRLPITKSPSVVRLGCWFKEADERDIGSGDVARMYHAEPVPRF